MKRSSYVMLFILFMQQVCFLSKASALQQKEHKEYVSPINQSYIDSLCVHYYTSMSELVGKSCGDLWRMKIENVDQLNDCIIFFLRSNLPVNVKEEWIDYCIKKVENPYEQNIDEKKCRYIIMMLFSTYNELFYAGGSERIFVQLTQLPYYQAMFTKLRDNYSFFLTLIHNNMTYDGFDERQKKLSSQMSGEHCFDLNDIRAWSREVHMLFGVKALYEYIVFGEIRNDEDESFHHMVSSLWECYAHIVIQKKHWNQNAYDAVIQSITKDNRLPFQLQLLWIIKTMEQLSNCDSEAFFGFLSPLFSAQLSHNIFRTFYPLFLIYLPILLKDHENNYKKLEKIVNQKIDYLNIIRNYFNKSSEVKKKDEKLCSICDRLLSMERIKQVADQLLLPIPL